VRELVDNVDLLIHDSQYTPAEFPVKNNWGHCTVDYAVWLAQNCHVRTLALFHHDPTRSDDAIDEIHRGAVEHCGTTKIVAAYEGLTLELH
jgi:ribonuclease BN (tRNA processing enzyme)